MRRKRIIADDDYCPARGDKVCLRADNEREGGTVVTPGSEQSEIRWDDPLRGSGYYPNTWLMLKPLRQRKRLQA